MLHVSRLRCEYLTDPIGIDAPRPRLSWELHAGDPARRGARQIAYRIVVRAKGGSAAWDSGGSAAWDSGKVSSSATAQVSYAGKPLSACAPYAWRVRVWDEKGKASEWSPEARFTMGLAKTGPGSLPRFCWIGPRLPESWSEREAQPSPYLRRTFTVPGPVRRAVLFASSLGVYEARINGARVGDRVLSPEWTDYRTRVQYQGYDVTAMLHDGENALAAALGPGWYAGQLGLGNYFLGIERGFYGRLLGFAAYLLVEPDQGEPFELVSDAAWKCTTGGPIRGSDLFTGETYDARREMPGWDQPGFDDASWEPVQVRQGPPLCAQPNEPIRITQDIAPVAVTQPSPGTWIFDLGQNISGWVRMTVRGAPGTEVRIRHGEALDPDGTLYRQNLRIEEKKPWWGALQEDRYICRGGGEESFEPHFTYHGFRYVEVTGLERAPEAWNLVGRVLHSDAPETGSFECSSSLVNRIMAAIQWTQRDNMHGIPTDCPQRDERLGWAGDIQIFSWTAMLNRDMAGFFTKWLRDLRDAQTPDGRLPDFAPHPYGPDERFSGNPGWSDAAVVIPWRMYLAYGDLRILEESFDAARRWVEHSERENPDLIWRDHGRLNPLFYGDWLNADTFVDIPGLPRKGGEVPKEVYATALFANSARLLSAMARALGRNAEADRFGALARRVRAAFLKAFVAKDGRIKGDTQAGYALALHYDLLPAALRVRTAARMVAAMKPYHGGLSTGFLSTVPMMRELVRWGYADEAYRLLLRREMPSWGYMVEHGGTTMWERWDGWVEGRGFQNPSMNSFNHYGIGSVGEWMYRIIGGINLDGEDGGSPGLVISPVPGKGITWARATYHAIGGPIEVGWRIAERYLSLDISLPPNTSATVIIPGARSARVTEAGAPVAKARGVRVLQSPRGPAARTARCRLEVQSGAYHFRSPWEQT